MLKPNIQLFAEEAEPKPAEPTHTPTPTGKTFTEDYVLNLREESKNYRISAKTNEAALRSVLGLKDGEEIGDVHERIAVMQKDRENAINDALSTANKRLISAEIRALDGYDHKLLAKVIDMSNVKVDENGDVTGLKEAVEAAAKEFPAVLKKVETYSPLNPASNDYLSLTKEQFDKMTYNERIKLKEKEPQIYKKSVGGK